MSRTVASKNTGALVIVAFTLLATRPAGAQTSSSPPPPTDESSAAPASESPRASEAPASLPPPPPRSISQPAEPYRWISVALSAAGFVAGGVFGVLALRDQSDFEATPTQALADQTSHDATLCDLFLGVGVLSAAVAVVLFVEHASARSRTSGTETGRAAPPVQFNGTNLSIRF